ncbi:MAG TPA: hypothetical protein DDY70_01765, partial [Clostridiales bacterium]|nr:hypothetical protein [Clostridiales bacterium]
TEGARAVFYLEVEKTVGESTVLSQDFEKDYLFRMTKYTSMSGAENHTAGGGKSAATTYFSESMILFPYGLSAEDFGRRFRVSFWIKPTADRAVFARIRTTAHAQSTYMDPCDTTYTPLWDLTVGEWNEVSFDYAINDPDYVRAGIQKVGLYIIKSGAGLRENRRTMDSESETVDTEIMYIDDIVLTEIVTPVTIGISGTDGAKPGLVTHPSKKTDAAGGHYGIANGEDADKTLPALTVSGRAESEKGAMYKKYYAKLSLDAYDIEETASVTIRVKNAKFGNLLVYGVADIAEAADWSADSMSWYSAPANDRSGAAVDPEKVYGGAPIAKIAVLGTGLYTVNVTEYARAIRAAGGSVGTLIFVSDTQPGGTVITDEDFNDYVVDFDITRAGDAKEALISAAENYPDGEGYSYEFLSAKNYDRVKFDVARFKNMTRADIGRRFRVTYQMKADKTGTFTNIIVNRPETYGDMQLERKSYETAGVWQEYSYDFEVTDKLIFADTTGTILGSYFGICFDKMGARAEGGEEDVTVYIDNIRVVELSSDDISFEFVGGKKLTSFAYTRPGATNEYTENFDTTTSITTIPESTGDGPSSSWAITRRGFGNFTIQPATWANHTTGGKGGAYTSKVNSADAVILFYNLITPYYGSTLTEFDIGRQVSVSFWFRSRQTGSFDLTVSNYTKANEKSYAPVSTETIDAAWSWKEYTYTFTVTAEMVRENAALLCLRLNGFADYSGTTSTECNLDDIHATVSDAKVENLLPIRYEDFSRFAPASGTSGAAWPTTNVDDALNESYGVVWAGTNTQTVNYSGGQNWADHTQFLGGTAKAGLQFWGELVSSQIKFYNMITPVSGNTLTEADIGRSFRFSFWLRGEQTGSFRLAVTSKSLNANTFTTKSEPYTVDTANTWKEYVYEFTVTEEMVKNSAALPTLFLDDGWDRTNRAHVYIDDLLCYELPREAKEPTFRYSEDFENLTSVEWTNTNGPLHSTRALTYGGFEAVAGAGVSLVSETDGNKAVKIHSNKIYNRVMLYNVVSPRYRTEATGLQNSVLSSDDLGRQFLVTFRLKSEKAGSFDVSLTAYTTGDTSYTEKVTLSYTTPGEWQSFSYLVTVNRAMIEKNAGLVTLTFAGFGQNANGSEFADIFLDDVTSTEFAASASYRVPVSEATAVSNRPTDGTLSVDRTTAGEETLFGIRKAYLAFANLSASHANRAELVLRITEAEGQTLKIYGLPKALADSITWNTAPANRYDEGVDLAKIYGGKPLVTLTAEVGEHRLDVTEYVRAMGGYAAFVVVTEDAGGKEYLHADFSSVELFAGVDYLTDDSLTLSDGVGRVSGKSITFKNVFGGRGKSVRAGQEYLITVKVSATTAKLFTLAVDGTAVMTQVNTADGTLTLRYTATAEDEAAGVSSLTVSADTADFTLDELVVADTSLVTIEEATLSVYEAIRPTLSADDFAAKSNITLSSDFGYNFYLPVAPGLSAEVEGETLDMTSPEILDIDGRAYVKIRRDLAAKNGADILHATVSFTAAEGTRTGTYALSIPSYAKRVTAGAYDDTTKDLMRDMLSYIEAALAYFDTSSEEKLAAIREIIAEDYNAALDAASVGLTEENAVSRDTGSALDTVCLHLTSTPAFVFYLKEGKASLAKSFRFSSKSGAPLTSEIRVASDGRTYLEVTTYAYGMGDTLTFTYTDEDGNTQSGAYHLASYYLGIATDEAGITEAAKAKREELATLTLRLAKYSAAAKAYRTAVASK